MRAIIDYVDIVRVIVMSRRMWLPIHHQEPLFINNQTEVPPRRKMQFDALGKCATPELVE